MAIIRAAAEREQQAMYFISQEDQVAEMWIISNGEKKFLPSVEGDQTMSLVANGMSKVIRLWVFGDERRRQMGVR